MAHLLTAARAVVSPESRREYLEVVARLARRLEARGQHLWVFELRGSPGTFVEFAEGKDNATHRSRGPADEFERQLEERLRELASYDHTRDEVWDAVALAAPEGA